jgi:hypothetical protein
LYVHGSTVTYRLPCHHLPPCVLGCSSLPHCLFIGICGRYRSLDKSRKRDAKAICKSHVGLPPPHQAKKTSSDPSGQYCDYSLSRNATAPSAAAAAAAIAGASASARARARASTTSASVGASAWGCHCCRAIIIAAVIVALVDDTPSSPHFCHRLNSFDHYSV